MKKIGVLFVLLISVCFTLYSQSVTGDTSGLKSSLLSKLKSFAKNTGKDLYIRSGSRTEEESQALWDAGLARGGHISSEHPGKPVSGYPPCDITSIGGNAVHAPKQYSKSWMEIARPKLSKHGTGEAADVYYNINGNTNTPVSWDDSSELKKVGLRQPVSSESWHIEE
jgi:hypothetical protein